MQLLCTLSGFFPGSINNSCKLGPMWSWYQNSSAFYLKTKVVLVAKWSKSTGICWDIVGAEQFWQLCFMLLFFYIESRKNGIGTHAHTCTHSTSPYNPHICCMYAKCISTCCPDFMWVWHDFISILLSVNKSSWPTVFLFRNWTLFAKDSKWWYILDLPHYHCTIQTKQKQKTKLSNTILSIGFF